MKSSIAALRAITGTYLKRLSFWGGVAALIVFALIGSGLIYLATTDSGWWWFMLPLIPLAGVAGIAWFALHFAAQKLLPRHLEKTERQQIKTFTDSLFTQAASLQISKMTIVFMLIKDVLTGNSPQNRFKNIIEDGKTTKADFEEIRGLFEE